MNKTIYTISMAILLFSCTSSKQEEKKTSSEENATAVKPADEKPVDGVIDYLHVPGPIKFNQIDFNLAWSSHPSESYYKNEYLPKGDHQENYNQMIMLELALGDMSVKDAVSAKIKELDDRKSTDVIARYEVSENKKTNEVLLDFMLSENNGDKNGIVEWNAYRYANALDKTGKKGIILYSISKRGYGLKATEFLSDIKLNRKHDVDAFVAQDLPKIKLSN
jgi:hypothetical protein